MGLIFWQNKTHLLRNGHRNMFSLDILTCIGYTVMRMEEWKNTPQMKIIRRPKISRLFYINVGDQLIIRGCWHGYTKKTTKQQINFAVVLPNNLLNIIKDMSYIISFMWRNAVWYLGLHFSRNPLFVSKILFSHPKSAIWLFRFF